MQLINTVNGEIIVNVMTNHSMSIDDILSLMRYTVDEDGQIMDGETQLNAYYEDLDTVLS